MRIQFFKSYLLLFVCACSLLKNFAQTVPRTDSITIAVAPNYDKAGKTHRLFFGNGYRSSWAAPVTLRIIYLSKEKGGLRITQKGGGKQTQSLRLADKDGKEYVLRTIQKYPELVLPDNLRSGLAKAILQDQVVTIHPYASVTVPMFAEALGVPHTNPEIVYVADDPNLGDYKKEFANKVFLIEEREPTGGLDTDNTEKVQAAMEKDHDAEIDQRIVLRARLLDMILGDWDRHEDQWRWKKEGKKKDRLYTPVPRDRDMVYYNTTGIFPWIVSHQWLKGKFQGFHDDIRDVKTFNLNARYVDRYFLNQLDEKAWEEAISFVQTTLTDSLINASIHKLPDTIFNLTGQWIITNLVARRNNISKTAMEYYRYISKTVEIPASDKREQFFISKNDNGNVSVTMNKVKKDGSVSDTIYNRSFDPSVTEELRLYGMDGEDIFSIDSNFTSPIKFRLVGGADKDSFYVHPTVKNKRRLFIYDRKDEDNSLPDRTLAKRRLAKDSIVNSYDKKSFDYDRFAPVILGSYGPDEGVQVKLGFFSYKQGFRKKPFAFKQELYVNYSFGRQAYLITYNATFKQFWKKNDLVFDIYSRGPQNLSNFFGIGNNTVYVNEGDQKIRFYRSRYDFVTSSIQVVHPITEKLRVHGGVSMQFYTADSSNNKDRFFGTYNFTDEDPYQDKTYAGLVSGIVSDHRNDLKLTTKGYHWHVDLKAIRQLNGDHNVYGQLLSEFSFYATPFNTKGFIVANRTGFGTTVGNPSFFQLLYLGGTNTMRGFRTNRFAGNTAVYDNLECRIKLFDFNSYLLPGTVGLVAFNDFGRVWVPGELSNKWHDSYGGGLYITPAELVTLSAVLGLSNESTQLYVNIGFRF